MNKKQLFYLLSISLITSCIKPDNSIKYIFENNLSIHIEFLYPKRYLHEVHFGWGTMYDLNPTDTTSASAWHAYFTYTDLFPNTCWKDSSGYSSIEEMSPYDTVRIFVFDGRYHYLPEVNQNEIFESESYFCRYDLTSEDLLNLMDQEGNIRIAFPPSIEMSKVKMFPKYEEAREYSSKY